FRHASHQLRTDQMWLSKAQYDPISLECIGKDAHRPQHNRLRPCGMREHHGESGTGDIAYSADIDSWCRYIGESVVDVFVGDGGENVSSDYNLQPLIVRAMITGEIATALTVVAEGGCAIIKVYDTWTPYYAGLWYILSCHFDKVTVVKPLTSRPTSAERYIVCMGRNSLDASALVQYLMSVCDEFRLRHQYPTPGQLRAPFNDIKCLVQPEKLQGMADLRRFFYASNTVLARQQQGFVKLLLSCIAHLSLSFANTTLHQSLLNHVGLEISASILWDSAQFVDDPDAEITPCLWQAEPRGARAARAAKVAQGKTESIRERLARVKAARGIKTETPKNRLPSDALKPAVATPTPTPVKPVVAPVRSTASLFGMDKGAGARPVTTQASAEAKRLALQAIKARFEEATLRASKPKRAPATEEKKVKRGAYGRIVKEPGDEPAEKPKRQRKSRKKAVPVEGEEGEKPAAKKRAARKPRKKPPTMEELAMEEEREEREAEARERERQRLRALGKAEHAAFEAEVVIPRERSKRGAAIDANMRMSEREKERQRQLAEESEEDLEISEESDEDWMFQPGEAPRKKAPPRQRPAKREREPNPYLTQTEPVHVEPIALSVSQGGDRLALSVYAARQAPVTAPVPAPIEDAPAEPQPKRRVLRRRG
ncbi:hypothetical protein KIPB_007159, partial [Kipferlia bialata]